MHNEALAQLKKRIQDLGGAAVLLAKKLLVTTGGLASGEVV